MIPVEPFREVFSTDHLSSPDGLPGFSGLLLVQKPIGTGKGLVRAIDIKIRQARRVLPSLNCHVGDEKAFQSVPLAVGHRIGSGRHFHIRAVDGVQRLGAGNIDLGMRVQHRSQKRRTGTPATDQ